MVRLRKKASEPMKYAILHDMMYFHTLTTMSQWATKRKTAGHSGGMLPYHKRTSGGAVREVVHLKVVYRSGKGGQMIRLTSPVPVPCKSFTLQGLNSQILVVPLWSLGSLGSCCMAFISSKAGVIWPEGHGTMKAWECNFTSPVLGNLVRRSVVQETAIALGE